MVMTELPPVARLVHAARDGDARAFGELVERFQSMAQGYALALLRDPGLAEDACQEAFVDAFFHLHQLREDAAFLAVSNGGPHIPEEVAPQLFEPFRRLDGHAGSVPGAGLGLSIVRSVAIAHHGEVTARSLPAGGLEVSVVLPGDPARAQPGPAQPYDDVAEAARARGPGQSRGNVGTPTGEPG